MKAHIIKCFTYLICLLYISCGVSRKNIAQDQSEEKMNIVSSAAPKQIIYKTRKDYSNLVPIILSSDKKSIVSYPHPSDLMIDGKLATPVKLPEGYLLDIKGINAQVAFLKITYSDYRNFKVSPTIEQLKESIEDANPLIEMWDCGIKTNEADDIKKITQWIITGDLANRAIKIK